MLLLYTGYILFVCKISSIESTKSCMLIQVASSSSYATNIEAIIEPIHVLLSCSEVWPYSNSCHIKKMYIAHSRV